MRDENDGAATGGFGYGDSVFLESGVPSLNDDFTKIYQYVSEKGEVVGAVIAKNRGVPPKAVPENMLSIEEKAVVILGRACGVPGTEVRDRINERRAANGIPPVTQNPGRLVSQTGHRYRALVEAIQADLLSAIEAYSPLVTGPQRIVWRARILEFYREEILTTNANPELDNDEKIKRIRKLDSSMLPHLNYFEKVNGTPNLPDLLKGRSDRHQEFAVSRREQEIEEAFNKGKIDDVERIQRIRELRHDPEVD